MKTALVAGSTGLIGSQLVELLVTESDYAQIKCLARRPLSIQNQKIEWIETDGSNLNELGDRLKADDVYCCLGTTIKKAKTKEAFRKIDFDYPLELARVAKALGSKQFHLVSALGADASSSIFYNQVKGELEAAIEKMAYQSFHVYRPSLLLGDRKEERSAEDAAKLFFKLFGIFVPLKYKAIDSIKVARAMLTMSKRSDQGKFIHESKSLHSF